MTTHNIVVFFPLPLCFQFFSSFFTFIYQPPHLSHVINDITEIDSLYLGLRSFHLRMMSLRFYGIPFFSSFLTFYESFIMKNIKIKRKCFSVFLFRLYLFFRFHKYVCVYQCNRGYRMSCCVYYICLYNGLYVFIVCLYVWFFPKRDRELNERCFNSCFGHHETRQIEWK